MQLDVLVNQFRLASRELFNHYFLISPASDDAWGSLERFREVQEVLFRKIVTEPALLTPIPYGDAQPEISVELRDGVNVAPIMINRDIDSGYWDYPLSEVTRGAELFFVSFFDWDQLNYRDNQYVRVQVSGWIEHQELSGKHALIESQYVHFAKATGR
jgi:hypothetical protein